LTPRAEYVEQVMMPLPDNLYLGTVSWSKQDWLGSFYPPNTKPAEFLTVYARAFRTVEIDSTFYSIPTRSMVTGWRDRSPKGFVFAAKVPRVITHQKVLIDCQQQLSGFLKNMEPLGEKLGPLLLQFPYFNKNAFASREHFDRILRPFLSALPKEFRFSVEIRNKNWISWDFLEMLREQSVGFTLLAQAWMPGIDTLAKALDLVTADFCYVRFMGDRKELQSQTQKFDAILEDKSDEMKLWASELRKIVGNGTSTYVFFSNYYAGYGPGSAKLFEDLWENPS
jgi:uncharacterized protein YecE (DUF72 family)